MSAVIALRNPEVQITVVDISGTRIDAWNSEKMPIIDPRLDSIVKRVRGCNLAFTLDVDKAVYEADMIFICVGILTKKNRTEKDMALDMSSVDVASRQILQACNRPELGGGQDAVHKIVVEKSTVPCGTARKIRDIASRCLIARVIIH